MYATNESQAHLHHKSKPKFIFDFYLNFISDQQQQISQNFKNQ